MSSLLLTVTLIARVFCIAGAAACQVTSWATRELAFVFINLDAAMSPVPRLTMYPHGYGSSHNIINVN